MIAKQDRQQAALDAYLAQHPQLAEEIASLSEAEQQQQVQWAFEDAADDRGLQPWEYALELIAESPEQLRDMRLETHREVAEALGMSWEEYCQFNEL
ncbi:MULTISPECIES: DUF6388 family protein [unclassified Pseudomonas]|uniref:DUF6388 family protein n=1 Tax=unclassified Pseudomonas TaxID=196821 RepID=UPI000BC6A693|nr:MULTISPECIES: DUF6388 family protein [unclassified Pseudomonas]PVZ13814.1 hypothetical protein F474_02900 [Pseudomonas sp. URIL14HWK12:I12]PVZ24120.1 hypothetical protein F470_02555 [Pseudomonas sp. URIL14HWK12:I10]PVZ33241.1 hypothetical protein F472_02707 [Pseudomonas sp. URIL14HWK12:I11]SNZ10833.1 hypothetical protein SAMN05660463_01692 [Pseudomonas sp. URIL14HWK12:I9]